MIVMVIGAVHLAKARTFPPVSEPGVAKRGRRQHLLEKALAEEEAERQGREAELLQRIQAKEAQQQMRREAARAFVRSIILTILAPFIAIVRGVRAGWAAIAGWVTRALMGIGAITVSLARAVRSASAAVTGAVSSFVLAMLAIPGRTGGFIGAKIARARETMVEDGNQFGRDFRAGSHAIQKFLRITSPGQLLRVIIWALVGLFAGVGFIVVAAVHRSRNALADAIGWLGERISLRQAATYGYATVVGLALVAVVGQLIVSYGPATEPIAVATNEMTLTAQRAPAETPDNQSFDPITAVMALNIPPAIKPTAVPIPEVTRTAKANPRVQNPIQTPLLVPARARIAVVIDDMGMVQRILPEFAALDGALNFAFLPYSPDLAEQTSMVRQGGHQLLVHMPMEPKAKGMDPGPHALLTGLSSDELAKRIAWNLDRFDGYVGINNHMGSLFTEDRRAMQAVIDEVKARNLFFFDSMTTAKSVGYGVAGERGVPRAQRDIFLDNDRNTKALQRQLRLLEATALRQGQAIAIGHPHRVTLEALKAWIPTLEAKGIELVALSDLVESPVPVIQVAQRPAGGAATIPAGLQD